MAVTHLQTCLSVANNYHTLSHYVLLTVLIFFIYSDKILQKKSVIAFVYWCGEECGTESDKLNRAIVCATNKSISDF